MSTMCNLFFVSLSPAWQQSQHRHSHHNADTIALEFSITHTITLLIQHKSCILTEHNKSSYSLRHLEFISTPRHGPDLILNATKLQVQHAGML
jgi:hypothetical protein